MSDQGNEARGIRRAAAEISACRPHTLQRYLKDSLGTGDAVPVAVALASLSTIRSGVQAPPWLYEQSLEVLATSNNRLAGSVLFGVATAADNATVRLEAIRRLGSKPSSEARELLRAVARRGFDCRTAFPNAVPTEEQKRVAAVEALGNIRRVADQDLGVIMDVLRAESGANKVTKLFAACNVALSKTCRRKDIARIVDLIGLIGGAPLRIHVVGVLDRFSEESLLPFKEEIAQGLVVSLPALEDNMTDLTAGLSSLAGKVTCQQLVKSLPVHPTMHRGKGAVAAAALEAYEPPDDTLTRVYLRFAREEGNTQPNAPCVLGLTRCAQGGFSELIAQSVARQNCPGYGRLLTTGILADIFGGCDQYVRQLCRALHAAEPAQRSRITDDCASGLLWASLALRGAKTRAAKLKGLRDNARAMNPILAHLQAETDTTDCISALAVECFLREDREGKTALAGCFLSKRDALMAHFRDLLLKEGASTEAARPNALDEEAPIRQLEQLMFPDRDPWEQKHLADYVVVGGKVNRYVLDLMRRRGHRTLPSASRRALDAVTSEGQARFILACLALVGSPQACQVMAWAAGYEGTGSSLTLPIRRAALEALRGLGVSVTASLPREVLSELAGAIHARFNDRTSVRRAAYEAAGAFAAPSSISPLRERLAEERNRDLQKVIGQALSAVSQRLRTRMPQRADADELVDWLGQIGRLADASFLEDVVALLAPVPHSDDRVIMAALACAGELGDERAVEDIERFLDATSPGGRVRRAARRALAVLRRPNDVALLDVLARIFPGDSGMLDLEVDYGALLGSARLGMVTTQLGEFLRQWDKGHWNDCACVMDNVCDALQMAVFERCHPMLGWSEEVAQKRMQKPYGNRLHAQEFRKVFPDMQAFCLLVHNARGKSRTPHAATKDGAERVGVGQAEMQVILDLFRQRFPEVIGVLRSGPGGAHNPT